MSNAVAAYAATDPRFWAKKSCKDCFGRGEITHLVQGPQGPVRQQVPCACARREMRRAQLRGDMPKTAPKPEMKHAPFLGSLK